MNQLVRLITFKPKDRAPALLWENPTYVGSPPKVGYYNPRGEADGRASIIATENRGASKVPAKFGVIRLAVQHATMSGDGSDLNLGKLTPTGVLETVEAAWQEYLSIAEEIALLLTGATLESKFVEFMVLDPEGKSQIIHIGLHAADKCPAETEVGHRPYIAHVYILVSEEGAAAAMEDLPTFADTDQSATRLLHVDGATSPIGIPPGLKLLNVKKLPTKIPLAPTEKDDDVVEI